ncbi:MAG TPA: hypothetical protein VFU88_14070 [Ktedonobacterales bacterium]|nr:hypothetical protein [Ktedonobacterales bacterium]
MTHDDRVIKLYNMRARAMAPLAVLVIGALFTWALLSYFVWPSDTGDSRPWGEHNALTLVASLVVLLALGALLLVILYWLVTPLPLLRLDESGITYQPYPLVFRTVQWADVRSIWASTSKLRIGEQLRVNFRLRPASAEGGNERTQVEFRISSVALPVSPEEILRLIGQYHHVLYFYRDQRRGLRLRVVAKARTKRRRGRRPVRSRQR